MTLKRADTSADAAIPSEELASPTMTEQAFIEAVACAVSTRTELDLTGHAVLLTKTIKLHRSGALAIQNGVLIGACHSIFTMNTHRRLGPPALTLRGTVLRHVHTDPNPREIGACIFAMGCAWVVLENVRLSSVAGFGLWCKHECVVHAERCTFGSARRTGIALFNNAVVDVRDSVVERIGVHGVCMRGTSRLTLLRVLIAHCADRAVYAYQNASLAMSDCEVCHTQKAMHPAVEIIDDVVLSLARCRIHDNAGSSLFIADKVQSTLLDNEIGTLVIKASHCAAPALDNYENVNPNEIGSIATILREPE